LQKAPIAILAQRSSTPAAERLAQAARLLTAWAWRAPNVREAGALRFPRRHAQPPQLLSTAACAPTLRAAPAPSWRLNRRTRGA